MKPVWVKMILEYDGSDFSGWQVQPDQRTVQGVIENALKSLTGKAVRITGAGRTDAGVHALGMTVSFPYSGTLPLNAFKKGLNRFLPADVYVRNAEMLNTCFDARRHAKSRAYRYVLSKTPRAVGRAYAWYPRQSFDLKLMQQAADCLKGEHDFRAFAKEDDSVDNYLSYVYLAQWSENEKEAVFDIRAIRFFHNMIRILMGTMLRVGAGKLSVAEFEEILHQKRPDAAGPTIPPVGLFLMNVNYD